MSGLHSAMYSHRPIPCTAILLCLFAATATADPISFSISTRDGVKTANVELVSRDGVEYVPLGALVRQVGGGCEVSPDRAQVDLAEKSAWLRSDNPQVSASLGVFMLGAPVVRTGSDVLIAASDVAMFFEKAFRLAARRQGPAVVAPAVPPVVAQLPAESEPQALEPLGSGGQLVEELPLDALEPLVQPETVPAAPGLEDGAAVMSEPNALEPLTVAKAAAPPVSVERAVDRKLEVVVIDPGHGGIDAGCAGPSGVVEADIALGVAEKLRKALEQIPLKVVMTREQGRALSRAERVFLANSSKGDLLVSLHAGTAFDPGQRGCRVFVSGPDGAGAGCRYAELSRAVAEAVGGAVAAATGTASAVCQLQCQVVRDVGMPGVMVEMGMLTNPEEERLLATDEYQVQLAAAIAAGIRQYMESGNTESTR